MVPQERATTLVADTESASQYQSHKPRNKISITMTIEFHYADYNFSLHSKFDFEDQ
jgi:hypothetical protein